MGPRFSLDATLFFNPARFPWSGARHRWFHSFRKQGSVNLSLFKLLRAEAGPKRRVVMTASVLSGVANALILVFLNGALAAMTPGSLNFRYFLLFSTAVGLYLLANKLAGDEIAGVTQKITCGIRERFVDKLRRTNLIDFEGLDRSQLMSALTEQTNRISQGGANLTKTIPSVVMLALSSLYISLISRPAFWLSVVCNVLSCLLASAMCRYTARYGRESTEKENQFLQALQHLLNGFKELKMSRKRSDGLARARLRLLADEARERNTVTEKTRVTVAQVPYFTFYALLAVNVFVLPRITPTQPAVVLDLIVIIVFIIVNFMNVLAAIPVINRGNLAVEYLAKLEELLDRARREPETGNGAVDFTAFQRIRLDQVSFHYPAAESQPSFEMGPVSLEIARGEILFIRGGNGSGKSTLLKVLCGLYHPKKGAIRVQDRQVETGQYPSYREIFSVIFTDYHLFDRLYGLESVDPAEVDRLLRLVGLNGKTSFQKGMFTNLNLSTGQKKRLGLVVTFLENRPVCVFDEVAADQDPEFRKFFYESILPDLRRRGKSVVAATHDDQYFHCADRVITMDLGHVTSQPARADASPGA